MQPLPFLQQILKRLGLISANGQHTSVIHVTAKIRVALAAFLALLLTAWVSLQVAAQTGAVFFINVNGRIGSDFICAASQPTGKAMEFYRRSSNPGLHRFGLRASVY